MARKPWDRDPDLEEPILGQKLPVTHEQMMFSLDNLHAKVDYILNSGVIGNTRKGRFPKKRKKLEPGQRNELFDTFSLLPIFQCKRCLAMGQCIYGEKQEIECHTYYARAVARDDRRQEIKNGMPYTVEDLEGFVRRDLAILASIVGMNIFGLPDKSLPTFFAEMIKKQNEILSESDEAIKQAAKRVKLRKKRKNSSVYR